MPKIAKELSAIEVKAINVSGLHAVGGVAGLLLQVSSTGSKSWILRVMIGSKRRDIGLGGYPDVPLAMAREKAREARKKIESGIDPIEERKDSRNKLIQTQASKLLFDEAADQFVAQKQVEFKNKKHASQWTNTLKTYASPIIGKLPVSEIEINHLIRILEPIWLEKTETAKRLRGRIESVLSWATVSGFRTGENPARWKGHLEHVLQTPSKVTKVKHHKALPWQDIGIFISNLKQREGISAKALEFLILTASRSGEVRGATWQEIELENKMWIIPAERMKADKEHRIPLSKEAIKLLKALPKFEGNDHLFPASRGGSLSDMALSQVVKRMEVDAVPHGFRSTFRDWCSEHTNYPTAVAEMALAHTIGNKVEAAYRRGDLLAKRIKLMNEWAKYCNTPQIKGDIVSIRERKA